MNPAAQFQDAMRSAGLRPPDLIIPGKIGRCPSSGKRGDDAGWYFFFQDSRGGVYGDHRTGLEQTWQAEQDKPFTAAERETFQREVAEVRAKHEAEKKQRRAEAAERAAAIWKAATPAEDHEYLRLKAVKSHGLRLHEGKLVIPMRDAGGKLHSLQFISADGEKRYLPGGAVTGHYFGIGKPAGVICICEGYATAASVHEATGHAVAVAFDAGNLEPVAMGLRAKYPNLRIILCADNDVQPEKPNTGIEAATKAALAVNGLLAVPEMNGVKCDFNDLATARGSDAVMLIIEKAKAVEVSSGWPDPLPLAAKVKPEPYPIDALPLPIRAAVEEVAGFVKAPLPMIASSALAALSLAIQAHADAKRLEKLHGPVGLFLLIIADSGERKSTCDGFFTQTISDYEKAQAETAKPILKDYRAAIEAWESKRGGIKDKIRQLAKEQKPTKGMELALRDLEHDKPEPPRIPRLLYADATPEALAYGLAKQWPSGGVVSAEAGIVFGSHGMGKDSVMRNLGLLNQLWDGKSLTIDRRTSESFTVRGARLTVALQVQEPTLREFFTRSGALARGTGFLARFLVAWPESTQGMRQIDPDAPDGPATWPHLAVFHRRIAAILDQPVPIDEDGALTPPTLTLTPEAKAAWVEYHNAIESELSSGGELYDVRDVASKSADNAARLAALFHHFEGAGGAIGADAFEGASRITAWHLNESRRFFGELALPAELADAGRLDSYLIAYCQRERTHLVGKNHTRQHGPLRNGPALDAAIRELVSLDRVRLVKDGKRFIVQLNPALLDGKAGT